MIAFLVMIVLGFSVPLFNLGGNTDTNPAAPPAQPRLCQYDAECYLMCNNKPVEVLCQQNLCVQNSCDEFNLFPYQQQAEEIALSVTIDGAPLSLHNRNTQDLFVRFDGGVTELHASGLSLTAILEKAGIIFTEQCLTAEGTRYCADTDSTLEVLVNGEKTYLFERYVPKEGDEIGIEYS